MNRWEKIITAVLACGAIWVIYLAITVNVGWVRGGGAILMIIVLSIISLVWKSIVGKNTDENMKDDKTSLEHKTEENDTETKQNGQEIGAGKIVSQIENDINTEETQTGSASDKEIVQSEQEKMAGNKLELEYQREAKTEPHCIRQNGTEICINIEEDVYKRMVEMQNANPKKWVDKEFDLFEAAKDGTKSNSKMKNKFLDIALIVLTVIWLIAIIAVMIFGSAKNDIHTFETTEAAMEEPKTTLTLSSDDGLKKIYNKNVEWGYKGTFEQFSSFFNENDDNKRKVYDFNVKNGYKGSFDDFISFAGVGQSRPQAAMPVQTTTAMEEINKSKGLEEQNKSILFNALASEYDLGTWEDNTRLGYSTKPQQPETGTETTTSLTQQTKTVQANQGNQWPTYSFPKALSISIPPSMEPENDQSFTRKLYKATEESFIYEMICDGCDLFYEHAAIVFQPQGMNSGKKEEIDKATSTYARIIIEFGYNNELGQNDIRELTPEDLNEYSNIIESQYRRDFNYVQQAMGNVGSFVWYPVRKKTINGKYCLALEYDRSGLHGMVKVKKYIIYYNGKEVDITCSYRINESQKYAKDFEKVINSINLK